MEIDLSVTFSVKVKHHFHWKEILEGLCHGEAGAAFQERMEVFGEEVNQKLEAMMDEWPVEYFMGQYWEQTGDRFSVGFLTASDGDEFADDLKALFALCPVSDVRVQVQYDDE